MAARPSPRAAGRALEAKPHATDTRTFCFLFLPAEHDPDANAREFGAPGLRGMPWRRPCRRPRQLIEAASEQCLTCPLAEGRAHTRANARPLWSAPPDGTLKRQLLAEHRQQRPATTLDQLQRQWGLGARPKACARSGHCAAMATGGTPLRPGRQGGSSNRRDRAMACGRSSAAKLWTGLDGVSQDLLAAPAQP